MSIIVLGAVSTHFLIIAILIIAPTMLAVAVYKRGNGAFIKYSALLALSVLVLSSYWLVPAVLSGGHGTPLPTFTSEHWEVFSTVGNDSFGGVVGNVLSLHGFWGEREPWVESFALPKDEHAHFLIMFTLFASLVLCGLVFGLTNERTRIVSLGIFFFIILSVVFSSGIGESVFKHINLWLFEHVSFWKGFRDTQKWSGVVALGYALFAGLGAMSILSRVTNYGLPRFARKDEKRSSVEDTAIRNSIRRSVLYVLLALPLFYTPMMLFGFSGQLHTAHYPSAWEEVDAVLKQDSDCRALFLPWHQYYSLDFNNDTLTGNPARAFFTCDIVHGKNMELGSIESQGGNGAEYERIERVVTDNEADVQTSIDLFRELGIQYVIFTDDLIDEDVFWYPFLNSPELEEVMHRDGIYLYIVSGTVPL